MKTEEIVHQIGAVLDRYRQLTARAGHNDLSDLPTAVVTSVVTSMCDCIRRFAPRGSQYPIAMQSLLEARRGRATLACHEISGVLDALKIAYENGYLSSVSELIQAEMFSDFVEMAEHLLSEGYKDPAAVVVGSVLEEHLRNLATRNGVDVEIAGRAKKADQMNSELAGQNIYSKLDQKSVTSWLGLRNSAAHGKYTDYASEQVAVMIQGVRGFITRTSG